MGARGQREEFYSKDNSRSCYRAPLHHLRQISTVARNALSGALQSIKWIFPREYILKKNLITSRYISVMTNAPNTVSALSTKTDTAPSLGVCKQSRSPRFHARKNARFNSPSWKAREKQTFNLHNNHALGRQSRSGGSASWRKNTSILIDSTTITFIIGYQSDDRYRVTFRAT